jgi:hypothetical protein
MVIVTIISIIVNAAAPRFDRFFPSTEKIISSPSSCILVFYKKIQLKPYFISIGRRFNGMGAQTTDTSLAFMVPNAMLSDTAIFFSHTKKTTFAVCNFYQMREFHANKS